MRALASATPSPSRLSSSLLELIAGPSPVNAVLVVVALGRLHGADDRQVERRGEVPVALVLAGHRHDRAGAVAHEHVVGDEHRDAGAGDRVGRPAAGEDARSCPCPRSAARCRSCARPRAGMPSTASCGVAAPPVHAVLGALGPAAGRDQLVDERVLGGQHHEGRAEQRVGSGREDLDAGAVQSADASRVGGARRGKVTRAPWLRPIQFRCMIRTFSGQSTRSRSSASRSAYAVMRIIHWRRLRLNTGKLPRSERPSLVTSSLESTVPRPGHQLTGASTGVGQPLAVEDAGALDVAEVVPAAAVVGGQRAGAGAVLLDELGDRPGAAHAAVGAHGIRVVPGVVDLQEDPLGPAVVLGVDRLDGAAVVVAQPQAAQLARHDDDVVLGGLARVLAGLHGVLLGRQPEGVVAQAVQDVLAEHPVEAREDVGGDVAQRVADVQAGAARVGEHVEHEEVPAGVGGDGAPGRPTDRRGSGAW